MNPLRTTAARVAVIVTLALSVVLCAALPMRAQTPPPSSADLLTLPEDKPIRGASWPALSPDGKMLCFSYLGDLWTVSATGGVATRLTVHEALDASPHWSPDGNWIAFTSTRNGNADVFLVPATGGEARQVTFNSANDWVNDWSPDGNKLLFYSVRDTRAFALYSIDLHSRAVKRLTNDEESLRFGAWAHNGKTIAYTRAGQPWWRPWYHGSVAATTILEDLDTGKVRTLLKTTGQQFWPLFSPDAKTIYVTMIYGDNNTPNLWRVPTDGGSPHPVTKYTTDAVRYSGIARDGSLLTYIWNGDIYTVRPDGSNPTKVPIIAHSDDKINNQERVTLTSEARESELSPDGKQLALVLRGDIWLIPVMGGDAKRLTDVPTNNNDINWSPDGAKLVFISDRDNQDEVYVLDVKTKAATRLTHDSVSKNSPTWSPDGKLISYARAGAEPGLYIVPSGGGDSRRLADGNGNNNNGTGINSHSWSPDSKWVAFSRMDRYENVDIWVVPAVGGTAINVTRYPGENVDPKFTKDGRRLLFISSRDGSADLYQVLLEQEDDTPAGDGDKKIPKPDRSKDVKIDFDDIHLRAKEIQALGGVTDFMPTPDSQKVVIHTILGFQAASLTGGGPQLLALGEQGNAIRVAPDGSHFYYLGADAKPHTMSLAGGGGVAIGFSASLLFDRRVQYREAFNEFYRKFGAAFYDAKMHGVDWKGLRDKYEPLLQGVGTPEDFANLLSEMVGEVNSSHSEISPSNLSRPSGPQTATLGISYDDAYSGPGLKVSSVMPKGPADKPSTRVNPGDYILSIDGTDVKMTEDYYQTLQDKAGKTVELLVNNKPTKEGAHTIKIKPIAQGQWFELEYQARVRRNRERVDKFSDNRLAYLHIRGMDQESLKVFERELWSDALNKDGLILDIRGNGGGNTHDAILAALSRRIYGYTQPRDGFRQSQPERAWTKPIILLIDQNSYSDAEIFPAGFRALKLGKIVGVPTPGYVIGTYGGRLVDGTSFRMPSWGWYTIDGKNMENLGIPPDITVENTAEDIAAHRDRQLEVAVQTALREIPTHSDNQARRIDNSYTVLSSANSNPNGGSSEARPRGKKQ